MKAMRPVYEIEDDVLPTDWDCMTEDPPMGFWFGTHTREGMRIKGFTENEYIEGEGSGTVMRDGEGKPIYLGEIK